MSSSISSPPSTLTVGGWVFDEVTKPLHYEQSTFSFSSSSSSSSLSSNAVPSTAIPLGPGEILVELCASTICGSDVHTIEGRRTDPAAPLILGHEGMGKILALGGTLPSTSEHDSSFASSSSVFASLRIGQRITWGVATSCGHCLSCTEYHIPQKCLTVTKYGHAPYRSSSSSTSSSSSSASSSWRTVDSFTGTYATHILLYAGTPVVPLSDHLPDAIAAPTNCALATICAGWRMAVGALTSSSFLTAFPSPASLATYTVSSTPPVFPKRILIQGCGLLGLYLCALASTYGSEVIVATDVSESRRSLALRFGATHTVNPLDTECNTVLKSFTDEAKCTGYDAVFEVCGVISAVKQAVTLLRPGGVLIIIGVVHPHSALGEITGEMLIRKCIHMIGIHNYSFIDLQNAVQFLERTYQSPSSSSSSSRFPYEELCSSPYPLTRLPEAIEIAKTARYARVLIVPPHSEP